MFILKLGAEALSLKSVSLKENNSTVSSSSPPSTQSISPTTDQFTLTQSDQQQNSDSSHNYNNRLLESLLTKGLAHSALLESNQSKRYNPSDSDESDIPIKRSHSVHSMSKSVFLQALNANDDDSNANPKTTGDYKHNVNPLTAASNVFTTAGETTSDKYYIRPRSDTLPDQYLLKRHKMHAARRKHSQGKPQTNDIINNSNGILYRHLLKQTLEAEDVTKNSNNADNNLQNTGDNFNMSHSLYNFKASSNRANIAGFSIPIDEVKVVRRQINYMLKSVMRLINEHLSLPIASTTNASTVSSITIIPTQLPQIDECLESKHICLVNELWHRMLMLLIIQMSDESSCQFIRCLLISILRGGLNTTTANSNNTIYHHTNGNQSSLESSNADSFNSIIDLQSFTNIQQQQLVFLQKIQDLIGHFSWIRTCPDAFNLVLFWLFGKYGYPDQFAITHSTVLMQLPTLTSLSMAQRQSILELINHIHDTNQMQVRQLFCSHLPSDTPIAEFLLQWT